MIKWRLMWFAVFALLLPIAAIRAPAAAPSIDSQAPRSAKHEPLLSRYPLTFTGVGPLRIGTTIGRLIELGFELPSPDSKAMRGDSDPIGVA